MRNFRKKNARIEKKDKSNRITVFIFQTPMINDRYIFLSVNHQHKHFLVPLLLGTVSSWFKSIYKIFSLKKWLSFGSSYKFSHQINLTKTPKKVLTQLVEGKIYSKSIRKRLHSLNVFHFVLLLTLSAFIS